MTDHDKGWALVTLLVIVSAVSTLAVASAKVDGAWCEGYAEGSGQDCRTVNQSCVCADEMVKVSP